MDKKTFVRKVASEFAVTQEVAAKMIGFVLDTFTSSAMEDGKAQFGPHKMVKKQYKERAGRNPQTGETLIIPAKEKPLYKYLG